MSLPWRLVGLSSLIVAGSSLELLVSVQTSWSEAPLAAELLEGLTEVGRGPAFLRDLASKSQEALAAQGIAADVPPAWSSVVAEAATAQLCCGPASLYARFLSLRVRLAFASAKVEASRSWERHDREALGEGLKDCHVGQAWAVIRLPERPSQVFCGKEVAGIVEQIDNPAKAKSSAAAIDVQRSSLDHVLYEQNEADEESNATAVLGYVDLGSVEAVKDLLPAFIQVADKLRSSGKPGWVAVRHGNPGKPSPGVLPGYGVELHLRSTDEVTKSADGEASGSSGSNLTAACVKGRHSSDPAELTHGIDLAVLARRHPNATAALCALQKDLHAAVESTPPPWELKRVSGRAALRTVQAAQEHGGRHGLATLIEVSQDFPSGWAHVLRAGGEDEETARNMIREAEDLPASGRMTLNGWLVLRARRNLMPLLQTYKSMIEATEVLGQRGFQQLAAAEILREMLPPRPPSKHVLTADPRLPASVRQVHGQAAIIYDVLADRRTSGWDSGRKSLIGFVQNYGRFWGFPPPVRRQLMGIELVLDPCDRKQMQLPAKIIAEAMPMVVWVTLTNGGTDDSEDLSVGQRVAALMQQALRALVKAGSTPADVARFLTASDSIGCSKGAEEAFQKHWKTEWAKSGHGGSTPSLSVSLDDPIFQTRSMPTPSAIINGRVTKMSVSMALDNVRSICGDELSTLSNDIRWGRVGVDLSDAQLAQRQYLQSDTSAPHIWHPSTSSEPRYQVLEPEALHALPGGVVAQGNSIQGGAPVAHVLLLADAGGDMEHKGEDQASSRLVSSARFLKALARHTQMKAMTAVATFDKGEEKTPPESSERLAWLGVGVVGDCPAVGQPLSLSGAMRRCLSSALPPAGPMKRNKAGPSELLAQKLLGVAKAWGSLAQAGTSKSKSLIQLVLEACKAEASSGGWTDAARLRPDSLVAVPDDVSACQELASEELPANSAMVIVNGVRFGPILSVEDGVAISAAHFSLMEAMAVHSAPMLSSSYSPSGVQDTSRGQSTSPAAPALQAALSGDADVDLLLVVWALAFCGQSLEEVQVARSSGEETTEHVSRTADVQEAFLKAPDRLKLELLPVAGQPCPFHVHVVLNPLSEDASRALPVLRVLHEELNTWVSIALKPEEAASLPITAYHRFAELPPSPVGGLPELGSMNLTAKTARFALPSRPGFLMSLRMDAPDAWLLSAIDSEGLDLASIPGGTEGSRHATYRLEALFVEGFAYRPKGPFTEAAAGVHLALAPAQGRGKRLGEGGNSVVVKSGYFQLRGPPGMYDLALAGESAAQLAPPNRGVNLVDLAGYQALLRVHFKPVAGQTSSSQQLGSTSIDAAADSYAGAGGDPRQCGETIHIFSVASGHRYERLLRIMLLSVRQHTKCPLRLWLVDNFLSPSFRHILPALGRRVGFAVSSVTYKWPSWLRQQTETQRVIWAYKVLFLDVLFPLQVHRVLFIDADQIVRADVKEVWDTDMRGHVYGFVPFCGSSVQSGNRLTSWSDSQDAARNPETIGFRFWEQGFWKTHLGPQRYYYISALFLVDLDAFRKHAAGDMIRDMYQSLTRDPHSLANLDQDLLNYAQESLPIYTLPFEWLWCETWCSESTKAQAKTIDMCQNPVRKEGKLQQARRIAPEWTKYDDQLEAWIKEAQQESA